VRFDEIDTEPWGSVLATDVANARPIVTTLLKGRVTFTPMPAETKCWRTRGEATLAALFQRRLLHWVWRPHRD
jgi:hypothetical protein